MRTIQRGLYPHREGRPVGVVANQPCGWRGGLDSRHARARPRGCGRFVSAFENSDPHAGRCVAAASLPGTAQEYRWCDQTAAETVVALMVKQRWPMVSS